MRHEHGLAGAVAVRIVVKVAVRGVVDEAVARVLARGEARARREASVARGEIAGRAKLRKLGRIELQAVGSGSEVLDLVRVDGGGLRHLRKDEDVVARAASHLVSGSPSDNGVVAFPGVDAV